MNALEKRLLGDWYNDEPREGSRIVEAIEAGQVPDSDLRLLLEAHREIETEEDASVRDPLMRALRALEESIEQAYLQRVAAEGRRIRELFDMLDAG
jgi:hypothetical protein